METRSDPRVDLAAIGGFLGALYLAAVLRHALVGGWEHGPAALLAAAPFVVVVAFSVAAWRSRGQPITLPQAAWPLLLWPFVYDAAVQIVMLEPGRYVDAALAQADAWLLGRPVGPPTWALGGPAEEIANVLYASYYAVIPLGFVWFWARRSAEDALRYGTAILASLTACATVWLLLPAGGWHATGSPESAGLGPFTAFVRLVYDVNPHYAGAFPSSHVALATTAALLFVAAGASRWWVVWAFGIAWSTIYGQYHYAVDSPPALVIGALSAAWAARATGTAPARSPTRPAAEAAARTAYPRPWSRRGPP
jgi:membrane-associated phospholipid phosphatase